MRRTRLSEPLAVIVAWLALAALALAIPSGPSPIDRLDPALRASWPDALRPAVDLMNVAGSVAVWLGLVVVQAAIAWVWRRRWSIAVAVVAMNVAAEVLSTVLRVVVDRPRPPLATATELFVTAGFPSGHVTRTVVFTAAFLVALPVIARHRVAWLVLGVAAVVLMAVSRVDVSAHYASDTLGGVLLGAGVVGLAALLMPTLDPDVRGT